MTLPRLEFDDLPVELQELLGSKYARLGYLGEFFQVAAGQPAALAGFIRFTESLKSALPHDITEVVALTVAVASRNDYERNQHERLALSLGFDENWIRAVECLDPAQTDTLLTATQRGVQRLVLAMMRSFGRDAHSEQIALEQQLPNDLITGVLLTACRYIGHACIVNTLRIAPPVSSPFHPPAVEQLNGAAGPIPLGGPNHD